MSLLPNKLIAAEWVAPMDGPVIRDGAVVVSAGKILAVGTRRQLQRDHPDAVVEELGHSILMPGLVNAHTHLELSDLKCGPPPTSFVDWILGLIGQTARLGEAIPERVALAIQSGVAQCLKFGVTAVGDISKQCMFTRPVLKNGPLRVVSYGEIQAMAKRRGLLEERFAVASDLTHESDHLKIGITPHAPYTVEPQGYRRCLDWAKGQNRPLATHLAETPEELEFLAEQTGPFRFLWEAGINAWDDQVPPHAGGPIRFARDVGLLDYPTLLAHVNYCDDEELAILAAGKASIVYCPRTHVYFGHGPHRWREMLAKGINVAVGTDSCASSPDLNIVDDLRFLHRIAPEIPALQLWQMATIRGARAIQFQDELGSIAAGKWADLAAFPAAENDPLAALLETSGMPARTWRGGEELTAQGFLKG
jgi:cytosine/adenosine deaminase-related metal-dependent hydrolase